MEDKEVIFVKNSENIIVEENSKALSGQPGTEGAVPAGFGDTVSADFGGAASADASGVAYTGFEGDLSGNVPPTDNGGDGSGGTSEGDNGGDGSNPNNGNPNNNNPNNNNPNSGDNPNSKPKDPQQISFNKGVLIGILCGVGAMLVIVLVIAAFMFGVFPRTRTRSYQNTNPSAEERVDNSEKMDMEKVSAKLEMLQDLVGEQYLFDMDIKDAEEGVYRGYMSGLGDKYSQYYSAEEFQKLTSSMEGVFYGIGATVQKDPDTGIVTVVGVIDDSPAEKAGVKAGDIIYSVGDQIATDIDLDTLVYDLIRGEKGTDVTITFIRDGEKLDITITRGEVKNTTVYCELMDGDIGFIEVSQFTDETVPQFKKAVDDMINQGAKGLVIDLRNNSGGVLLGAVEMIDYLIPDGVKEHDGLIVYTANKEGVGERYFADDKHEVDIPIVLLVNGFSASASEVFTGALMDYDWADVVGTQTFGKGIVQTIMPLADGSAVKMTVEHYYTPDGTDLHGEGLTPDYEIELDKECQTYTDEHDNQYAKAVEIINSKTK